MTPAVAAARRAGIRYRTIELEDAGEGGYGERAAAALGVSPGSVFKTLVARVDGGRLVVALVPVDRELDLKALAALAGGKRAEMAEPREAERATGYLVGGISPLGQKRRLETFAERSIADLPLVYVSGGRRGLELELEPADLVALGSIRLGAIARAAPRPGRGPLGAGVAS